jgi:methyl-accepting chemotaxis protein
LATRNDEIGDIGEALEVFRSNAVDNERMHREHAEKEAVARQQRRDEMH